MQKLKRTFKRSGFPQSDHGRDIIRAAGSFRKVLIIHHTLLAGDWHPEMKDFLEEYLMNFWDCELSEKDPNVLIVFDVSYANPSGIFRTQPAANKDIAAFIQKMESELEHGTALEKLQSVPRTDVIKWGMEHLPYLENLVEEVCGKNKKISMKEAQNRLRNLIIRHNNTFTLKT